MYALPRHAGADGVVATARFPRRGIAPGCPWAMTWAKVYTLEAMRALYRQHPAASLSLFVDDIKISAEGKSERSVAETMVRAGADVLQAIEGDLEADAADEKATIVASSDGLAQSIARGLHLPSSSVQTSSLVLGGEVAAGKQRRGTHSGRGL